ncbi:efflux RND transporter periplasmic adaptor subunit [Psychrosphaera sp.]|nr:efflux RND transporter periplasmic adaptor subunit [Psychrosphaera sp.]
MTTHQPLRKLSLTALAVLSLFSIQACEDASASLDNTSQKEEIVKVPVEAELASRQNIGSYYAANAVLESRAEADVISKVQGLVEGVYVEEGDYVQKGQLLAKLDSSRYVLALQQREAALAQVKSELHRLKSAKNQALVSADTLEKLEWQYKSLQASTDVAKLDVKETEIIAPISGYVSARYVKVGNLVHQYQHQNLFHIVAQDKLEGVIYLPEGRLPEVKKDQPVQLKLPAIGAQSFNARISRISPVIDANNGTFKVVVEVSNSENLLKPGMFAEVNIELGLHNNALVAPSRSVISIDNSDYVYKIIEGKAVKTKIEAGYRHAGLVEILSGVSDDEALIVAGHNNLKNDALVSIVTVEE